MKTNSKINLLAATGFMLAVFFTSCQKEDPESILPPNSDEVSNDMETAARKSPPVVPSIIEVPAGHKLISQFYARGFQIYKCLQSPTDTSVYVWTFQSPLATLYGKDDYTHVKGTHYAGPTWANNQGSTVAGVKLQSAPSPDPGAIPWLLLQASSHTGNGLITTVTYIQRVNTSGGLAPTTNNDVAHAGQEVQVPYTAEYYFYQAD